MRREHALVVAGCLAACAALAPPARPQDGDLQPYFWPHRTVGIPVDADRIAKLPNKPSSLQLYYSVNRSAFQKGPKLPPDGMQQLDGGKKGFLFAAERDGDYEFTVQFVYPDGSTSPRSDELTPQQRIVIDATPPAVRLQPSNNGVEWRTTDDNLDPAGVTLQCKWPTSQEWTTVTERAFRASDTYAWKLPPGKVLEVRVQARDRAGNEGVSPVVKIPPDAATGVGFPKGPVADWPQGNPNLPAPRIDYVNTLKFDVDYAIQRMGRSGVQAAHLFVLKSQGNWELVKRFPVRLMPGDKDPQAQSLSLPYEAKEEGTYGFYVLPESGAGKKGDDPRREDPPMLYVVVDTTMPYVQITGVQAKKGGARGPIVEITWKAADPNLMPQPISLEWSLDAKAAKWNEIKYRLDNNLTRDTGRYAWEVPDENLWKFYVRIRAVDKASNTGEHVWGLRDPDGKNAPAEVIVDLDTPSGTINKARGGNTPSPPGGGSPKPPTGSDSAPRAAPTDLPKPPTGSPALPALP
ncbi:hypothetical protein [Gemmata sp.]|uniref:hypothetical protein n=1 Tax=Gemmata sp. TaxID=1914242 RepID=UPI003F730BF9